MQLSHEEFFARDEIFSRRTMESGAILRDCEVCIVSFCLYLQERTMSRRLQVHKIYCVVR